MDEWTSRHNGYIAAPGASNPRPFGYESYALTNCAATARAIHDDFAFVVFVDNG